MLLFNLDVWFIVSIPYTQAPLNICQYNTVLYVPLPHVRALDLQLLGWKNNSVLWYFQQSDSWFIELWLNMLI